MARAGEIDAVAEATVDGRGHGVALGEAVRTWGRIAALSFGGPAGQIAVMHRILVEEKRWIGEERTALCPREWCRRAMDKWPAEAPPSWRRRATYP